MPKAFGRAFLAIAVHNVLLMSSDDLQPTWSPPPGTFVSATDGVDLWLVDLSIPDDQRVAMAQVLSPDEVERAARYRFDKDRRRYEIRRSVLRHILAAYTGIAAADLVFERGPHGKPTLPATVPNVRFNLSFSAQLALIGVTRDCDLGVDIQHVDATRDLVPLAERFFAEHEAREIADVAGEERVRRFYRYWTRKEAIAKATGRGLTMVMEGQDVDTFEGFQISDIEVPSGFAAAIAVEGQGHTIHTWTWSIDPA
jgi:4'-phosphopantetheinyl transferase